jgi:hypothetical protein
VNDNGVSGFKSFINPDGNDGVLVLDHAAKKWSLPVSIRSR